MKTSFTYREADRWVQKAVCRLHVYLTKILRIFDSGFGIIKRKLLDEVIYCHAGIVEIFSKSDDQVTVFKILYCALD